MDENIKGMIFILFIAIFCNVFIFNITYVSGESMYPTLDDGDILLVEKYKNTIGIEKFEKGDLIVFDSPVEKKLYIKRVIAGEGDSLIIKEGEIRVNGRKIEEEYIMSKLSRSKLANVDMKIPKDHIFVLGDNRDNSYDSRDFGSINLSLVKGKVRYRVYPGLKKVQ